MAACGWQAGAKDEAVKTFLAYLRLDRTVATADQLRARGVNLGLTDREIAPLEAVRAATLESHPELRE